MGSAAPLHTMECMGMWCCVVTCIQSSFSTHKLLLKKFTTTRKKFHKMHLVSDVRRKSHEQLDDLSHIFLYSLCLMLTVINIQLFIHFCL